MGGALVTGNAAQEAERATLDAFSSITRPYLRTHSKRNNIQ